MISPSAHVMTLLRHGVPITLIADLLAMDGPRSREILTAEAATDDVTRDDAGLRPDASTTPLAHGQTG